MLSTTMIITCRTPTKPMAVESSMAATDTTILSMLSTKHPEINSRSSLALMRAERSLMAWEIEILVLLSRAHPKRSILRSTSIWIMRSWLRLFSCLWLINRAKTLRFLLPGPLDITWQFLRKLTLDSSRNSMRLSISSSSLLRVSSKKPKILTKHKTAWVSIPTSSLMRLSST